MKCNNCDYSVSNEAIYCPNCGSKITDKKTKKTTKKKEVTSVEVIEDTSFQNNDTGAAIAWGALGFFIPIVGLILFIVWKNDKPIYAKGAGIGALIKVGISILILIVFFIFFFLSLSLYTVSY